ncbi:MAG TPA: DUF3565 domain-containing protein [Acidimicrobiales bacterium]|nr:DUF3565 domain-containing protein [Acidimicrobiales bacterium]
MQRRIEGFRRDEVGDWVAELACLHGQHVRHRPPFQERPWVDTPEGRAARVGTAIDCPLCDRLELPEGLEVARGVGPFDDATVPAGLRRQHRVAAHTWALIRLARGSAELAVATDPPRTVQLSEGESVAVPPEVPHTLGVHGPVQLTIEFLVRPGHGGA